MLCDLLYLIHQPETPNHGRIKTMAKGFIRFDGSKWLMDVTSGMSPRMLLIGRYGDFEIDDRQVSRLHCAIEYHKESGCYSIHDLDSRNGTYVNGLKLAKGQYKILDAGATIKIGAGTTIRFE